MTNVELGFNNRCGGAVSAQWDLVVCRRRYSVHPITPLRREESMPWFIISTWWRDDTRPRQQGDNKRERVKKVGERNTPLRQLFCLTYAETLSKWMPFFAYPRDLGMYEERMTRMIKFTLCSVTLQCTKRMSRVIWMIMQFCAAATQGNQHDSQI